MRNFWVTIGFVTVFGAVSFVTPAMAQVDDTATTESELTTEESKKSREERLKEYKAKTVEKLTEAKSARLAARCKAAQGKITSLRARIQNIVANRKKVYQEVGEKLDTLLIRLQAAGLDTAALETAIADIKVDLATLSDAMEAYDVVLSDLETMDCEADPEAFSAALSDARAQQAKLKEQATEFRRFATTELKAIIQELKSQLEKTKSEASDQPITETSGDE